VLIDSAIAHDPMIKARQSQVRINTQKLNSDKAQWTRYFGVLGDVRYGTFDNWTTNAGEGQIVTGVSTRTSETRYSIGAYVKFSIYDIINNRNDIRYSMAEIDQAENMTELQIQEVRQKVIKQYNDVIVKQRLMKIKLKYLQTAEVNMQLSETEFRNGVIPLGEYARISSILSLAQSDFESARMDFLTAFMILEDMAGMKLSPLK
jgi:outer membrane protein TolC